MAEPGEAAASLTCRSYWIAAPGRGEIRTTSLPRPGPDEVLVRTRCSGISRGTESLVFSGLVPPRQYRTMRCPFQEGEFPGPVKYGYISVGAVEEGPAHLLGRRVFCLYPHQDRYVVPAAAVLPIPDAVPDERALLAANMETAINGLWDGAPRVGDRIAVVGGGVVGALAAALAARIPGTRVELVDVDPGRASLAAALGVTFAGPDAVAGEADLVVHASGTEAGLETALTLAGREATVLELSWYGDRAVSARLGGAFHDRRLTLRASQVGEVAPARRARWSRQARLALALSLLTDPMYDALLGGRSSFAELPATMVRLTCNPEGELCHIVAYEPG